jgi:plastocyanin
MQNKHLLLTTCASLLLGVASLPAATNVVLIGNYFFNPTNLTINVGDTVLWTNTTASTITHDTTSTNAAFSWASGDLTSTKRTFSLVFTNAGTFPYMCARHVLAPLPGNRHPEQTGTVSVVSANVPPAFLADPVLLPDGRFRLTVSGTAGQSYTTEISSNLTSWSALVTNVAPASTFNVTDSTAPGVLQRFYRTRRN